MTAPASNPPADFADWLSPMIVKELRQGMRSRVFVVAFYVTQALMILSVILNLIVSANDDSPGDLPGFLNGLFWFLISVPLVFVMPLRGFGALYGELKHGTLELVFLTRLSAWRIASGKWWGMVGQTVLLVCAILPYVLLRYFLGGVDIVSDLRNLFLLLLGSATLTAATLAMSPYESKILRALFIVGMVFGLQALFGISLGWMMAGTRGLTTGSAPEWKFYLGLAVFVPAFIVLCLELAASKIAPPAENHSLPKRLLGLYFPLAAAALAAFKAADPAILVLGLALSTPVVIDALSESIPGTLAVQRRFLAHGKPGRWAAAVFAPGWPSATGYFLLFGGLSALIVALSGLPDEERVWLTLVSFLGALLFPAALNRFIRRDAPHFLAFYFFIQFLSAGIALIVAIMSGMAREPLTIWLAPLPPALFLATLFNGVKASEVGTVFPISLGVLMLCVGGLLLRAIPAARDIAAALRQK